MRCPTCYLEIGTAVEPGPFNDNSALRKAGVAQWCKNCASLIPKRVIADITTDPQGFIYRATMKKKGDNARRDLKGVVFNNFSRVIHGGHDPRIAGSLM